MRSFADCARYVFTTMLGLCLPASPFFARGEYASLYPRESPIVSTREGKGELLKAFEGQLAKWVPLLKRFLKGEEDQIELMLTFEEFCGEEEVFSGSGGGRAFSSIFVQILKHLYDKDVLSGEAILQWADEKENADEEDKVFVGKCRQFIDWLREDSEDEDDDEEDDK